MRVFGSVTFPYCKADSDMGRLVMYDSSRISVRVCCDWPFAPKRSVEESRINSNQMYIELTHNV